MASFKERWNNLFFVKRRPKLHVSEYFEKPPNYEQELDWQGFITASAVSKSMQDQSPVLTQDLEDVEEHLLPAFWEFNQKANHFQNRYYLYQWVFMLGAFFSTLFGAATTYSYAIAGTDNNVAAMVLGVCTMAVSGITSFFTYMSQANSPQKRWAKTRRLAEELRMNYYLYLAHLKPYDKEDRVNQMRRFVIDIRRKENDNG